MWLHTKAGKKGNPGKWSDGIRRWIKKYYAKKGMRHAKQDEDAVNSSIAVT